MVSIHRYIGKNYSEMKHLKSLPEFIEQRQSGLEITESSSMHFIETFENFNIAEPENAIDNQELKQHSEEKDIPEIPPAIGVEQRVPMNERDPKMSAKGEEHEIMLKDKKKAVVTGSPGKKWTPPRIIVPEGI
jgi:hypothetical protein